MCQHPEEPFSRAPSGILFSESRAETRSDLRDTIHESVMLQLYAPNRDQVFSAAKSRHHLEDAVRQSWPDICTDHLSLSYLATLRNVCHFEKDEKRIHGYPRILSGIYFFVVEHKPFS